MTDINSLSAVTLGNISLTPTDVLRHLHQRGRLLPLLRAAAVEQFVLNQARQAGLSVTDEELQQAADRFRQHHGLTTAEQTRQWFARDSLTVEDFEAVLERDLLVARFTQHLIEPRIADHFAANHDRYVQAQLRQIVVGAEEVARELLAQITAEGREFADLAREHSLHGPSRLAGGSLGLVPRSALPVAAAEAVFQAKVGAVVGPVASDQGFHLFLVEALPEPMLDETTATAIRQELFDGWLQPQLRDMRIDLNWLKSS